MDINTVAVTGRLTKDPEAKQTQSGKTVVSLSVAISGFTRDSVHFVDVEWWPAKAEFVDYFQKGNRVAISGSLKQNKWEANGQSHSRLLISAQSVVSLEKPPARDGQYPREQAPAPAPARQRFGQRREQAPPPAQQAPLSQPYYPPAPSAPAAQQTHGGNMFSDEDIPF